jgi:hypothetical protein
LTQNVPTQHGQQLEAGRPLQVSDTPKKTTN